MQHTALNKYTHIFTQRNTQRNKGSVYFDPFIVPQEDNERFSVIFRDDLPLEAPDDSTPSGYDLIQGWQFGDGLYPRYNREFEFLEEICDDKDIWGEYGY